ncbi:hypothetical protein ACHAPZ_002276 [Fusarium culmorum]
MLPLFFQVVLLDSATTAGARLAIPSLATPIGGVIAGVIMSRWGKLLTLVRIGAFLMIIEQIRHSVDYIHELPLDQQLKVRLVYYDGIRYAFGVSTAVAVVGFCAACIASGTGLRTTHK